jgi:hypothetical protein
MYWDSRGQTVRRPMAYRRNRQLDDLRRLARLAGEVVVIGTFFAGLAALFVVIGGMYP